MLDFSDLQHSTHQLRNFHGSGAHQYGSSFLCKLYNLLNNSIKFFAHGFVNKIIPVFSCHRPVGRNRNHIQLIDVPQFTRFGDSSTRHTCKLMIHAKIILKGDGGVRLGSIFDLHILLRFNRLMQTIRVSSSVQHTTRLLIYNFYFSIYNDVFSIFFEKCIRFE